MSPSAPPMSFDALKRAGEVSFEYYRASGPGGQNVNKVSTAVRLRFDAARSCLLPEPVRARLVQLAGARMTDEGILLIEAQRFRTQDGNREDAIDRLMKLIARAFETPKTRRPTRPTRASRERRLDAKRRRSEAKGARGPVGGE